MLQHATGSRTIRKEARAVILGCLCEADRVLRQRNQRISNESLKAAPWNMEHVARGQGDGIKAPGWFAPRSLILVIGPPGFITPVRHAVCHQRIEHVAPVADTLRQRVPHTHKQVGNEGFSEHYSSSLDSAHHAEADTTDGQATSPWPYHCVVGRRATASTQSLLRGSARNCRQRSPASRYVPSPDVQTKSPKEKL